MEFNKNFGNKVEIEKGKEIFEGILLPSPEKGSILLKLENGFNDGFNKKEIVGFKVIEKKKKIKEEKEVPYDENKKNVAMVVLGGTISARLNPGKGGVDFIDDPQEMFKYYPEVFEKVNLKKVEVPFMKGSEDMDYKDWQNVSKVVCDLVNEKDISGVIVTQGTDTLHYTSAALSFFLRDLGKPVVLTFSQRSIDRGSSDARLNLICSAEAAISNISGVMVVGHANRSDEFCYAIPGTKVRKLHSSRRDAFRAVNREPFMKISKNKVNFLSEYNPRNEKLKCFCDNKFEEKIAMIKFYPGQDPDILDYYFEKGYRGIIVEALGLGQIATSDSRLNWVKKLKDIQSKGVIICFTPQTINGRLNPLVYKTGRELVDAEVGIYLEDMLSETAFVKLGWVLGHKDWNPKEKMLENFSWEINERLVE